MGKVEKCEQCKKSFLGRAKQQLLCLKCEGESLDWFIQENSCLEEQLKSKDRLVLVMTLSIAIMAVIIFWLL